MASLEVSFSFPPGSINGIILTSNYFKKEQFWRIGALYTKDL